MIRVRAAERSLEQYAQTGRARIAFFLGGYGLRATATGCTIFVMCSNYMR
jgi:hypothetical protein